LTSCFFAPRKRVLERRRSWSSPIETGRASRGGALLCRWEICRFPKGTAETLRAWLKMLCMAFSNRTLCRRTPRRTPPQRRPTLKRILQTHCYTTMPPPTIDGTLHKIRRAGAAEAEQQKIYEMLGVDHRNLPGTKMSVPMKNSWTLSCHTKPDRCGATIYSPSCETWAS